MSPIRLETDNLQDAYWKGNDAANAGESIDDNPYDRGSACFREWEKGFQENPGD